MADAPTHTQLNHLHTADGELLVNGRKVSELAREIGKPFYAYDANVIDQRLAKLRKELPSAIKLHYAIKANPMFDVVQFIAPRVDGLDVASGLELSLALTTDTPRHEISFAGPGKSIAELKQAVSAGIVLNVESQTELNRLSQIAQDQDVKAQVAIRVNPDFELKSSGMRMSGGSKPFGIDAELVPEQLQRISHDDNLDFVGLHIFSGSQNLDESSICEAQRASMSLALQLCEESEVAPKFLNLGGGFGIPYFPGDAPISLDPIAEELDRLCQDLSKTFPTCSPVIELGRYIVGEAGVYVCEITDIKVSRGQTFYVTNGGLHHHLAASGNFGQVIRKNYPVVIANKMNQPDEGIASVVGPLCTPLDLLANKMKLPQAEIGDLVAVLQSGAYGYTASPFNFLSHPPPAEIFCD